MDKVATKRLALIFSDLQNGGNLEGDSWSSFTLNTRDKTDLTFTLSQIARWIEEEERNLDTLEVEHIVGSNKRFKVRLSFKKTY